MTCPPGQLPKAPANVRPDEDVFIPIAPSSMVLNVGGNCGFATIEIIARHLGFEALHGFSKGKGGCTPSSMAQWLDKYGVEYMQASDRTNAIKILKQFLAAKKPVLFSIPGHALVCCGWTHSADGRELIWVVDNTGPEGAKIKGWPKSEWDQRFDGWVCGLIRCPNRPRIFPGPGPRPSPHVDPTPDLVNPQPKPVTPPAAPVPVIDTSLLDKLKADFEAKLTANGGDLSKVKADLEAAHAKLKLFADALEEIRKLKSTPGPGQPGPQGVPGPPGPQGPPGSPASSPDVSPLLIELTALRAEQQRQAAVLEALKGTFRIRVQPK